jgi:5'-nucleotidase
MIDAAGGAGASRRPRILVTNDDGIESRGLAALAAALRPLGEVVVVAPDTNQSAVSHLKTLWRPLRVRERPLVDGSPGHSVDGSPADAVSLAFLGLLPGPFDLVAAGINFGANMGDDIAYSGTVSAAMEGVINGCPSMAVSLADYTGADFTLAGIAAAAVARAILARGLEPGQLLNVNVPAIALEACNGIEVTRLGKRIYQDVLIRREDPRGVPYYWFGGPPPTGELIPGTDLWAVEHGTVSVTPIHLDLTAERFLERLRGWELRLD